MAAVADPGSSPARPGGALAGARRASGQLRQSFSGAGTEAAGNLLAKAVRRLDDGDAAAARGLVERALRLPYDDFEDAHPCLWTAHMLLFTELNDDLEDGPDEAWLERAAAVIEAAGPVAAVEARLGLQVFAGPFYQLPAAEARRLRAVAGTAEAGAGLFSVPGPAQVEAVIEVLDAVRHYRRLTAPPEA